MNADCFKSIKLKYENLLKSIHAVIITKGHVMCNWMDSANKQLITWYWSLSAGWQVRLTWTGYLCYLWTSALWGEEDGEGEEEEVTGCKDDTCS